MNLLIEQTEPSFEVAERIVKKRILDEIAKLAADEDSYAPRIELFVVQYSCSEPRLEWMARKSLIEGEAKGATLDEALANIPTPEMAKAKAIAIAKTKLAEAEAELAKLTAETKSEGAD